MLFWLHNYNWIFSKGYQVVMKGYYRLHVNHCNKLIYAKCLHTSKSYLLSSLLLAFICLSLSVFFFISPFRRLVAYSLFNHFTLASLTNLTLFIFSHIQAVHPTHFKILLVLPVPAFKSCHFLSVPEDRNPHPNIFIYNSMSSSPQNVFGG